jgi:Flp pilus assembly protein TadG
MMMRRNTIRKLLTLTREECGYELLEFAISVTLFMMAVLGVIGFASAVYVYHFVTWGAQQGTRFAIVRGADLSSDCSTSAPPSFTMKYGCVASATDVQNYVRSLTTGGINVNNVQVSTTWPGTTPDCSSGCSACTTTNSQGCMVKVQVSYSFNFSLGFLPSSPLTLSGTSERIIQN